MSLPWVKLHTSLLDNETFQRFSPAAKLTFLTTLMIAGKQDLGGRLEIPPFGAMDEKAISAKTGCRLPLQSDALRELVTAGFLSRDLNGTYVVERWEEKTGDESRLVSQRARAKRYRDAKRHVTRHVKRTLQANVTNVTDKEEDNYSSLRSEALRHVTWPEESADLRKLALLFSGRFASDPLGKNSRNFRAYVAFLARMRKEGVSVEHVWQAAEQSWDAGGGSPIFGAQITQIRDFLPDARASGERPSERYRRVQGL